MKRLSYVAIAAFMCLGVSAPAHAQWARPKTAEQAAPSSSTQEKIAVVVNDGIITTTDVKARLAFAFLTSNLPDTPDVRKNLMPQVIRGLIDEEIKIQEAKQNGLYITDSDLDAALQSMAEKNKIPGGDMRAFLRAHNVSPSTLERQTRGLMSWAKLVQQKVRPQIVIGDEEIQSIIDRAKANAGKREYFVSEIYLAVDKASDEEHVKDFAKQLMDKINNGTSFEAIARQFSQGTEAANGGEIGWVQDGQLSSEVNKAIQTGTKGALMGPVRSASGYHILLVRDDRIIAKNAVKESLISIQQLFKPFNPTQSKESLLAEVSRLRASINGCGDLASLTAQKFPAWKTLNLGSNKPGDLPEWLADKTRNLSVGDASEAMATDQGALILVVCDKKFEENFDRNEVLSMLGQEKLENAARRYLQDLRSSATIDVRASSFQ